MLYCAEVQALSAGAHRNRYAKGAVEMCRVVTPAEAPRADGAATLADVAAAVGVSPATVSRVINGHPVVAEATRVRVLAAVDRLNFRPNPLGRGLATRRTALVGLVIADITNPFYTEVARGVQQTAAQDDLHVLLYDTAEDSEHEALALRQLSAQRVDGIIICASRLPEERIRTLARTETPIVLINRRLEGPRFSTVEVDQEAGVVQAVEYLLALGHRRLVYIGGPRASQVQRRRLAAFQAVAATYHLALPETWILATAPTIDGGREAALPLLRNASTASARPTAILAYNDLIAIGAILAAQELGIAVPDGLSVIGHDDIPLAGLLRPALSTMRQSMRELGACAVRLLRRATTATVEPERLVQLPPELVVRHSTAPPCGSSPSALRPSTPR
jgi:LacI family transcriptional regulator